MKCSEVEQKLEALPKDAYQARLEAISELIELAGAGSRRGADPSRIQETEGEIEV